MICPVCRKGALIVEYNNIELDYCPRCQGVWFDVGELELLLESAGLGDHRRYLEGIINGPEASSSEKKRKCPICRRKMKKAYIDEDKKIMVDICSVGHGIWFDGGEVQSLVKEMVDKSPKKHASHSLMSFVSDMFKYRNKE
ncbi:MAG: zf-TFIIB domain-containing protein [Dehalococcoidales bacterium]